MSKGQNTRRAILNEALRQASSRGLEQLSIGQLAQAVGMSKSGLFAHFSSKEQLQLDVLRETAERFVAKVIAPALRESRGEPRIRAFFEAWLRWEKEEFPGGCIFQAASSEFDDQPGPVRDFLVETQRDLFDTITTLARTAVEAGRLRAGLDPAQFAFELSGIVAGYHRSHRLLRDPGAESMARVAFDSLLARAGA